MMNLIFCIFNGMLCGNFHGHLTQLCVILMLNFLSNRKDYTDNPLGKRGSIMSDVMKFSDREAFRNWLTDHCMSNAGVWLLFGKAGGPKTIKTGEALEEAL